MCPGGVPSGLGPLQVGQQPTLSPGTPHLRGNHVAGSLLRKVLRLGVYVLACLPLAIFIQPPSTSTSLRRVLVPERSFTATLGEPQDDTCWCNYDALRGGLEPFQWDLTNETTRRWGNEHRVFHIQARDASMSVGMIACAGSYYSCCLAESLAYRRHVVSSDTSAMIALSGRWHWRA